MAESYLSSFSCVPVYEDSGMATNLIYFMHTSYTTSWWPSHVDEDLYIDEGL